SVFGRHTPHLHGDIRFPRLDRGIPGLTCHAALPLSREVHRAALLVRVNQQDIMPFDRSEYGQVCGEECLTGPAFCPSNDQDHSLTILVYVQHLNNTKSVLKTHQFCICTQSTIRLVARSVLPDPPFVPPMTRTIVSPFWYMFNIIIIQNLY